jgi:GNAT superfamily N-acetyltransferase
MTENDIRILHIKVGDLPEFADRIIQTAKPGQFVPISMQRAIAHANNPYADENDIGLLAAVDEENEVVGYFGIMPMLLRVRDQVFKTHWFTTWSVSAEVRGKGVGTRLMEEALKLEEDFLIVGSVHARRVCKKFGFWEREPLDYFWIEMSGMGKLNPLTWLLRMVRKVTHWLKIGAEIQISNAVTRWVDRVCAPITRPVFYHLLSRKLAAILSGISYREVSQISPDFLHQTPRPAIELHRGVEAVNWMLSYTIAVVFSAAGDGEHLGFAVYSVTKKGKGISVKTLDFRVSDPSQHNYILALAVNYGKIYNADTIEIPEEVAGLLKAGCLGWLLLQPKKRIYQCHPKSDDSPLAGAWKDLTRHLYDGDMAFS